MTRRPDLPALTGLRFFAALWVLAFHTTRDIVPGVPVLGRLISIGYVGVSLFFVLSGFILVYTYWREEALDTPAFLWHRVARVLPVYWLAWLMFAPFATHRLSDTEQLTTGLLSFSLLQAWVPQAACKWNCPGWSLSAEALFYAAFPLLLIAIRRRVRLTAAVVGLAWIAGLFIAATTIGLDEHSTRYLAIEYNPLLRLPEFTAGMLVGRWYVRGGRLPQWLSGAPVALGVLIVCWMLAGVSKPLLFNGMLAPLFVLLIVALAPGGGLFANRQLQMLGRASYALYLIHIPFYAIGYHVGQRLGRPIATSSLVWSGYAITTIAASWLVLVYFEEPARAWLRRHEPRISRKLLAERSRLEGA